MLADKDQIKQEASAILKRGKIIEDAEARLKDQTEALTIIGTAMDSQLIVT